PLPREAKRIVVSGGDAIGDAGFARRTPDAPRSRSLFELVLQQREDLLAGWTLVRRARCILHGDETPGIGFRDHDPILFRFFRGVAPEHELRQETGVLLDHIGIGITDVIEALRAVAID